MLDVLGTPRLGDPVVSVAEEGGAALITTASGKKERFDAVVLAAHADQSLSLLSFPTEAQRRLLSRFAYQRNETLLHTDSSVMPESNSWPGLPGTSGWTARRQGVSGRRPTTG